MKRPSFQFYPGDWLQDAALKTVSLSAQGLWINMLCLMHQGNPYGYLKVNHMVIQPVNLVDMVGRKQEEVFACLEELKRAGVFDISDDGCMFSRRMIKDEEIRFLRAKNGSLGGNPKLKNKKVNQKDNHPLIQTVEDGDGDNVLFPKRESKGRATVEEIKIFCDSEGLPETTAVWFFNKMEGCGWINGKNPVKNWKATIISWRTAKYLPHQKHELNAKPQPVKHEVKL